MKKAWKTPLTGAERRKRYTTAHKLSAVFLSEALRRRLKTMREQRGLTNEGVIAAALDRLAAGSDAEARAARHRSQRSQTDAKGRAGCRQSSRRAGERGAQECSATVAPASAAKGTRHVLSSRKERSNQPAEPQRPKVRVSRRKDVRRAEMGTPDLFADPVQPDISD